MDDLHVYHANGGNQAPPHCTQCNRSIADAFHRVNDAVVCKSCGAEVSDQPPEAR
jgi:hypothetical protein